MKARLRSFESLFLSVLTAAGTLAARSFQPNALKQPFLVLAALSAGACSTVRAVTLNDADSRLGRIQGRQHMNSRRMFSILLIFWICLIVLENVCAEESPVYPDQAMPVGERLVYKITWLKIPVGTGELWVKETTQLAGREVIHIIGLIETNGILSKMFPMHDEVHSWIDAETFESVQFEKEINERVIKAHELTVFDASSGKGYYESLKSGKKNEFRVTVPVHDVLSAFYWVRRQVLVPGESVQTVLSADQKDWELEVKVLRREAVKLHGTNVDTFRLEPNTRVEGVERRGLARFNLTADASRTPVRIVYKAPFGSVIGKLKQAESP